MKKTLPNELLYLNNSTETLDSIQTKINNISPTILDYYQKNLTNQTDLEDIKSTLDELKNLLDDFKTSINNKREEVITPFICEYKWVKIGTPLVDGWEKVDLPDGYTITNGSLRYGTLKGITDGFVASHVHDVTLSMNKTFYGNTVETHPGQKGSLQAYGIGDTTTMSSSTELGIPTLPVTGNVANYVSGINAELWRYIGNEENN